MYPDIKSTCILARAKSTDRRRIRFLFAHDVHQRHAGQKGSIFISCPNIGLDIFTQFTLSNRYELVMFILFLHAEKL